MDTRRIVLYAALALIAYSLWTAWQVDYPSALVSHRQQASSGNALSKKTHADMSMLPSIQEDENVTISQKSTTELIHVKTDVLNLAIDLQNGDIVEADLTKYPESIAEKKSPFVLLQNREGERYVAGSSLFVVANKLVSPVNASFHSEKNNYQLNSGEQELVVSLIGTNKNGLSIKKEFVFTKNSYLITVRYVLINNGTRDWKGYMNTQLLRSSPQEDKSSIVHVGSYTGASFSKPGQSKYKKISFKDMTKSNLDVDSEGGWIAMQQHYFLTAWVPFEGSKNKFYTRAVDGDYTIGSVSQPITLAPQQQQDIASNLYLGPEITSTLKAIAPGLDLTVDYGWLWFISALLFSLLKAIYSVVGNWGWSIVLVTVLIKLAFYRLSATSYKSMAGMRKLQPKLLALREKYGDDKAKISQETMGLYKQEKVNPLGGCLPILIQIPVFIGLYWVLLESVELRQAPFMLWITDLSTFDPFHVLPIIMGITMIIQQKLNPTPPDPMQAKIMMFLPVLLTGLFWSSPAGLLLYWIVNNSLSILQQWYITRKYSDDKPTTPKIAPKKLTVVK